MGLKLERGRMSMVGRWPWGQMLRTEVKMGLGGTEVKVASDMLVLEFEGKQRGEGESKRVSLLGTLGKEKFGR